VLCMSFTTTLAKDAVMTPDTVLEEFPVPENMWGEALSPTPLALEDTLIFMPLSSHKGASPAGLRQELLQETAPHETPLVNFGNTVFYANISIGTPPKPFKVVLDTGSFIVWVPDAICHSAACKVHNKFSVKDSSTGKVLGEKVVNGKTEVPAGIIQYGTGAMEGVMVEDSVTMAGVKVPKSGIMVATQVARMPFLVSPFDGIVGLGRMDTKHYGVDFNFMKHAMDSGAIKKNIVSFFLSKRPGADGGKDGVVVLGGTSDKLYNGKLRWYPVLNFGAPMWSLDLESLSVEGGKNVCPKGCVAIIDTGTSLIVSSQSITTQLNAALGVKLDCSNLKTAPAVHFQFKGDKHVYKLPAHGVTLEGENMLKQKICQSGIKPMAGAPATALAEEIQDGETKIENIIVGADGQVQQSSARKLQAQMTGEPVVERVVIGPDGKPQSAQIIAKGAQASKMESMIKNAAKSEQAGEAAHGAPIAGPQGMVKNIMKILKKQQQSQQQQQGSSKLSKLIKHIEAAKGEAAKGSKVEKGAAASTPWGKVTSMFGGKDVVLVGDLFLRHHFSAFDATDPKNPKVGFATPKKDTEVDISQL